MTNPKHKVNLLTLILSLFFLCLAGNSYSDDFSRSTFGTVPKTLKSGEPAEVRLRLYTDNGEPVAGAFVEIKAEGGYFEETGDDSVVGNTDRYGKYRTIYIHDEESCGSASRLRAKFKKGRLQGHGHVFPEVSCVDD